MIPWKAVRLKHSLEDILLRWRCYVPIETKVEPKKATGFQKSSKNVVCGFNSPESVQFLCWLWMPLW